MTISDDLLSIRTAALQAADPALGVRRSLALEGATLRAGPSQWQLTPGQRVLLVAVGKAAPSMAQAAADILGEWLGEGIVVTKTGHSAGHRLPPQVQVHEAGHPTPDACGLQAASEVERLLQNAGPNDHVLALLSGGASALLPLPVKGVTLEDLQVVTGLLLRAGATIVELNTVRKHLDRLKGGGMARLAFPAPLAALILSDVVGDPLDVIASGPTVPDPTTFADAWAVLEKYNLISAIPPALRAHLHSGLKGHLPDTPFPDDPIFAHVTHQITGSNRQAALAAHQQAQQLGYHSLLISTLVEGEAREVGKLAAALAKSIRLHGDPLPPPACLILGGETTVTVRGLGVGGRNQELALSAALSLEGTPGAAIMALATDGTDGPTDAAGAIVDGDTLAHARALGLNLALALNNNDAYPFLEKIGALMKTGPTGTNVCDLTVILVK
jgi:hydroxypyruvate reductase